MGYVDRFIKKINLENKETLLPNLKPGDIVWAKRYSKEEVRKNIELEHQESPFIVIYKNELNIIYCLDCSSKEQTRTPNIIKLEKQNYPNILFRDTYVKLKPDVEMTSYRYIRKIGSLLDEDFNLLKKTLFLLMTNEEVEKLFSFPRNKLVYYLDSGDVIRKDGNYLLISYKTDTSYITYSLTKSKEDPDLTINNKPYKILYSKRKTITQDDIYILYAIYHKFKSYYERKKYIGYHKADIGDLIKLDDMLYLVYGKYKQYLVVIQIYTNTKGIKIKTYDISIHNERYHTGFEFFLLPSEHEYNIVSNILEFEICEYLNKIEKNNITPNLDKNKILKINNSQDITLSTLQKEIIQQLEEMNFTFEEIIGIMTCIKDPQEQLKYKKYLTINYNNQNKEEIKKAALNIENNNKNSTLKAGDIILAKRKNDPNFKNNIIKDHDNTGPYIVIYKDEENNIIYAMSGAYQTSGGPKSIFKVKTKCKDVFREDIIHIKAALPVKITKDDYIKKVDELSKEDLNTLIKSVYAFLYFYPNKEELPFEKEKLSYHISKFDIVAGKRYYFLIFDADDNYYYAHQLCESDRADFKRNNIGYMVNLKEINKLSKNKHYDVVRIISEDLFKVIKNKKRWRECNNLPTIDKIKLTPQRGDIVSYNNDYYLIFGEYKNYYQVYKLSNENSKDGLYTISTNTKTYKIYFDQYVISKNASISIKDHITEENLNEINNKRKNLKNTNKIYKPLDFKEEKSIELNNEQLTLITKLKEFNFSKNEIIGTLIALNNKFAIEEILDFIAQKEQSITLDKNILKEQILKIIRY